MLKSAGTKSRLREGGRSVGFLNKLFRRGEEDPEALKAYSGMRMEVMDTKERLIFVARATVTWEGEMCLWPLTKSRLNGDEVSYPVLLRGYDEASRKAVHMTGYITRGDDGGWSVEDPEITAKDNDRAFFRQGTGLEGEVMPMKQNDIFRAPCRLVNISAGGVCVRTQASFQLGDRLLLQSRLLKDWEVVPLMCVVRRGVKRKAYMEYGCEFVDLTEKQEDMIVKAILEMQTNPMQRIRSDKFTERS